MKNIFKNLIFILCAVMLLTSCKSSGGIVDVDLDLDNPTECDIANINYEEFFIVRTYKNGKTDKVQLTEDMIPEYERIKFYQPGNQTVLVNYMGAKLYLEVMVNRNQFDVEMNSETICYDGKPHELSFNKYLPNNVTIAYPFGKTFVDVGTHRIVAVISCPSFETVSLEAFLTITPATIDMSAVKFNSQVYTYDGEEKPVIEIANLPENISVTYLINGMKDFKMVNAGKYTITAEFKINEGAKNYNPISSMTAEYTINKGVFDVSDLELKNPEVYYTGEEIEWKIANTLPDWIYVTYENNKETEVGIYDNILVTLRSINDNYHFMIDNGNYSDEITIKLEAAIVPAE